MKCDIIKYYNIIIDKHNKKLILFYANFYSSYLCNTDRIVNNLKYKKASPIIVSKNWVTTIKVITLTLAWILRWILYWASK